MEHNIECIDFSEEYPYIIDEKYKSNMGFLPPKINRKLHLFSLRYILYYLYITNCGKIFDNIMVSDIRDVIFQKDPFDFSINGKLNCSIESEEWPIGRSEFNANEIRDAFGVDALDKLKDKLISNCGVTIGPKDLILSYISKMVELILAGTSSVIMDQGTHNYIVYNDYIKNIVFIKNNNGPVLTLGYEKNVYRNKQNLITDKNGLVINIIHQYDRHYGVAKDYYSPQLRIKYLYRLIKSKYIKKSIDNTSSYLKTEYPIIHGLLKKIRNVSLK